MMRLPLSASATIARYRGSKIRSGSDTSGNNTTSGGGKSGTVDGSAAAVCGGTAGVGDCAQARFPKWPERLAARIATATVFLTWAAAIEIRNRGLGYLETRRAVPATLLTAL